MLGSGLMLGSMLGCFVGVALVTDAVAVVGEHRVGGCGVGETLRNGDAEMDAADVFRFPGVGEHGFCRLDLVLPVTVEIPLVRHQVTAS